MRTLFLVTMLAACGGGSMQAPPDLAQAPAGDMASAQNTWTNFAQGFFASYCNSCHKPGGQAQQQDFSEYTMVLANEAAIRCGVAPAGQTQSGCGPNPAAGQFPIGNGPKPSDADRLRLVAWIDAGTPN